MRRLNQLAPLLMLFALLVGCVSARHPQDAVDLSKLISEGSTSYLVIDVRSPDEFAQAHIPTAVNIPVDSLPLKMPKVDEGTLILTYCDSGFLAGMAADKLREAGYSDVRVFGAIGDWKGELEKGQ